MTLFLDRHTAGKELAALVREAVPPGNLLVSALPRGGVPVAFEVAAALNAPLDIFVVRKLGLPREEELALGAIASGGVRVLNRDLIDDLGISDQLIESVTRREQAELERRENLYREGRPAQSIAGRNLVVVDDGLATGATMLAAVKALRTQAPAQIMVAVPVAARQTYAELQKAADQIICVATPDPFISVGRWYEDFSETSDEEVRALLRQAPSSAPDALIPQDLGSHQK